MRSHMNARLVTEENLVYVTTDKYDYNSQDFVLLNQDTLKVGDVIVSMTVTFVDPIDSQFNIKRHSHWIITLDDFNEKFNITYGHLWSGADIQPK
jgi:hypothetical protein